MDVEAIKNRVLEEAKAQGMTMSELARLASFSPSRTVRSMSFSTWN